MKLGNLGLCISVLVLLAPGTASAHCDTMDGPVVKEARSALAAGDVTPVLKWVGEAYEAELRAAFSRTMTVRKAGGAAEELADLYFLETAVRLHRATEGEPYSGLRPAGVGIGPAVRGSDEALVKGDTSALIALITARAAEGLRERFVHALEARSRAGARVAEGREYVRAYVAFVHYAERLFDNAAAEPGAHQGETHRE